MTLFDDRERAFEAKFRLDQEATFRITVRRDKLLGLWAAGEMGLAGDEAKSYAKTLVDTELEQHDVLHKVLKDFEARGIPMAEEVVRQRIEALHEQAREQVLAELQAK